LWALIAIIALIVLLIITLSLPLDIVFSLNTWTPNWLKIDLNWCWGLVRIKLNRGEKSKTLKPPHKTVKKKSATAINADTIFRIITIDGIVRQLLVLIRDLLSTINIKTFSLDIRIGFEDPVDNGYLFACIIPFSYLLGRTNRSINIQTAFENELVFDCNAYVRIRTFPILIVGFLLVFIFSKPVLRAIKIIMDVRWRKKR
jgi:hypothetical protein